MKWFVSTLAALAFVVNVQASDLRIISWNIEDATPHSKADFLAKVAKEQKADILALQNVNATPYYIANDISEQLGPDWAYRVTTSAKNTKQLAIFWNTRTVHLKLSKVPNNGVYEETDIQAGDRSSAPAQIGYFQKGAFDFFLINVNLMDAWQSHDVKLKQAEVLHNWVSGRKKALSGTENDFVVVGSFNFGFPGERASAFLEGETIDNPSYDILAGNGLLQFTMLGAWKKDPSIKTLIGDWENNDRLVDGFALSKGAARHYVAGSSNVLHVDKQFEDMDDYTDSVSNHLPVIARFKTDFED